MDQVIAALEALVAGALSPERWPFLTVCFTLAVIGHIVSTRLFTREQAYAFRGTARLDRATHMFFWWGRETMPAHPILAGLLLALIWRDPEGQGWSWPASAAYWTFCGALSLFVWICIKAALKHKGVVLELPGDSVRPKNLAPKDLTE